MTFLESYASLAKGIFLVILSIGAISALSKLIYHRNIEGVVEFLGVVFYFLWFLPYLVSLISLGYIQFKSAYEEGKNNFSCEQTENGELLLGAAWGDTLIAGCAISLISLIICLIYIAP